MSQAPPLPRRARTPSVIDSNLPIAFPTTKPLQIRRTPTVTRSTTPSSNTPGLPASPQTPTSPIPSPGRPQRSGLRSRQVSTFSNSDAISIDSSRTIPALSGMARSEVSLPPTRNIASGSKPSNGRSSSIRGPTSPSSETEMSPTSLAAIAAFQRAGRMRGMSREDEEYEREKEKEMAIQKDRQKRIRDKVPGRKMTGKHRPGDIDAILDEIKDEWEVVIDPDFNPVDLALQLLDDSSLGKDINSFRRTRDKLTKALKGSVDKHYQAFNNALPHHGALLNHLGVTQTQISDARTSIQEAKDTLGNRRADLVQLRGRSQTLEEMMRILDQIERLRSVPDALESLISEKRLLQAAVLLVRSLKLINKQDMLDIGALSDLRSYLNSQEMALKDILIDELNSHLYLKSFWCESRWAVYTPNQQTFPLVPFEEEFLNPDSRNTDVPAPSSPVGSTRRSRLNAYLDDLHLRPNDPPFDQSEPSFRNSAIGLKPSASLSLGLATSASRLSLSNPVNNSSYAPATNSNRNPEADSFTYIETLLESLAVLGKLGGALDAVAQKLPQEIYAVVETTIEEVSERAEYGRRASVLATLGPGVDLSRLEEIYSLPIPSGSVLGLVSGVVSLFNATAASTSGNIQLFLPATSLRLVALETSTKVGDQDIMRDFFWTLYSKLDAISQGLRVVYEVANRVGSRRDFKDSSGAKPGSLFPLAEVWVPVQAEVRTLLNDYITDEEQGAASGRNPISSINEVLREGRYSRDKSKPLFRFVDTDLRLTSKTLREHEDELTRALKDTVPGLVQGSTDNAVQATLSAVGTDDRLLSTGQHHRLLVRPDAFHVSILFQPTLTFMDRITEVLPAGEEASRAASAVLDEFVLKVYLPQLEEKVSLLFHQYVTGPDAFQPDLASTRLSPQPLITASVQLMALVNSLCAMLRTTPFHRENYSRLVLTVIVQFYQRCSDKFQDLVSLRDPQDPEALPRVALAAQWSQRPELIPCLNEISSTIQNNGPVATLQHLCQQESNLENNLLAGRSIRTDELVASTRDLSTMASLHYSVAWFASELNSLKSTPEGATSPTTPQRLEPTAFTPLTAYRPSMIPVHPDEKLSLPLSAAMALRFQALHKTYEQLSEVLLNTIRVDIRCRIIHHLDLCLRHGNYCIDREASEPDPHITDLNTELGKCDAFASTTLPEQERRFIFEGIGNLMEGLLVSNAKYIRAINAMGVYKMMRNILALQQNIKTITHDGQRAGFERAKRYYSLCLLSPLELLDVIREKQEFSLDEYKALLDLQCGVDPNQADTSGVPAADRNYGNYIIELYGLELENSADDASP